MHPRGVSVGEAGSTAEYNLAYYPRLPKMSKKDYFNYNAIFEATFETQVASKTS